MVLGTIKAKDNIEYDIQLKGSGRTKFSRNGDGYAGLGSVIREYIMSESMRNLGIETTRALAFCTTGNKIFREKTIDGAVLTRVAKSHIRVGTFEYFAHRNDYDNVKKLADYVINRHYPECLKSDNPYLELLRCFSEKQANLISSWMSVGFIHGVMNTDNVSIIGETIDYGPCAFIDEYQHDMVFSSIDYNGRYAYINQPYISHWNLMCFANCLAFLIDSPDNISDIINEYPEIYEKLWLEKMCKKIGILNPNINDRQLIIELLEIMHKSKLDFTNSFRNLLDDNNIELKDWKIKWLKRLATENKDISSIKIIMDKNNPLFIPRNHQVQKAINYAENESDYSFMDKLLDVMKNPYNDNDNFLEYTLLPNENQRVKQTFCGT